MAKYGRKAQKKIEEKIEELKEGTLKSGETVKNKAQAVAIALSETRKEGDKVPDKKKKKTEK